MRWLESGAVVFLSIAVIAGCSNPDQKANKLYVEASELVKAGQAAEDTSYAAALGLYTDALAKIESITAKYPSSLMAVELAGGKSRIGPHSIQEFRDLVIPSIRYKADAEDDAAMCALLVLKAAELQNVFERGQVRDIAASHVAVALAASGRSEMAFVLADEIEGFLRSSCLRDVAVCRGEVGDYQGAVRIAEGLEASDDREDALARIAGAAALRHEFDRALEIAELIDDADWKRWALNGIAGAYAGAGKRKKAMEMADANESVGVYRILVETVQWHVRQGSFERALALVDSMVDEYGEFTREGGIIEICAGYVDSGKFDEALALASTIGDGDDRATALVDVARGLEDTGHAMQAADVLSQAKAAASSCDHPIFRVRALAEVAVGFADAGQQQTASELILEALYLTKNVVEEMARDTLLRELAAHSILASEYERVVDTMDGCIFGYELAFHYRDCAHTLLKHGSPVDVLELARMTPEHFNLKYDTVNGGYLRAIALAIASRELSTTETKPDREIRRILRSILKDVG